VPQLYLGDFITYQAQIYRQFDSRRLRGVVDAQHPPHLIEARMLLSRVNQQPGLKDFIGWALPYFGIA
jgi:hypothetical protein